MSDYGYGEAYNENGEINQDVAVFQGVIVETNDLTFLDNQIIPILKNNSAKDMLWFMNTYLDPQIINFINIIPEIYGHIYELAFLYDSSEILLLLMDRGIIFGFSGNLSYFEVYYYKFWSHCPDIMIEIIMSLYPGDEIDFFKYCLAFLKRVSKNSINIGRFLEYLEQMDRMEIYFNNYFLSIFDVACYLFDVDSEIFEKLKSKGIIFNPSVHELSPESFDKIDFISETFPEVDMSSLSTKKMDFLMNPIQFFFV